MPEDPTLASKVAVRTLQVADTDHLPLRALSPPPPTLRTTKDAADATTSSSKLAPQPPPQQQQQQQQQQTTATSSNTPDASAATSQPHAKLNNFLRRRSTRMELQLRNIIKIDPNEDALSSPSSPSASSSSSSTSSSSSSSSVMSNNSTQTFSERKKILKSCLKRRMSKKELVDKNIIKDPSLTPEPITIPVGGARRVSLSPTMSNNITSMAEQLRRAQISDTINQHLQRRPSKAEIPPRILTFHETVEVSDTFRRGEYNRKPDQQATYRRLTPRLKQEIRAELNEFKRNEMDVHEESSQFTTYH